MSFTNKLFYFFLKKRVKTRQKEKKKLKLRSFFLKHVPNELTFVFINLINNNKYKIMGYEYYFVIFYFYFEDT